jgi:hypothetical protein
VASTPSPPLSLSLPVPPSSRSLPALPLSVSLPAAPKMRSAPSRPEMVLAALVPASRSLPAEGWVERAWLDSDAPRSARLRPGVAQLVGRHGGEQVGGAER